MPQWIIQYDTINDATENILIRLLMDIIYTGIDLTCGSNSVGNIEPSVSVIDIFVKNTTWTSHLYKVFKRECQADISLITTEECNVTFFRCNLESKEK